MNFNLFINNSSHLFNILFVLVNYSLQGHVSTPPYHNGIVVYIRLIVDQWSEHETRSTNIPCVLPTSAICWSFWCGH